MCAKSHKGFSLIEVLVAMALLGLIGVAFLSSLTMASRTLITTDERETAKNIAEMQMEHLKSISWATNYEDELVNLDTDYPGYSTIVEVINPNTRDTNIQKITVTIQYEGRNVYSISSFKENRKL